MVSNRGDLIFHVLVIKKRESDRAKRMQFWAMPPVLVVQLKRWDVDYGWVVRNDALVHFPVRGLDVTAAVEAVLKRVRVWRRRRRQVSRDARGRKLRMERQKGFGGGGSRRGLGHDAGGGGEGGGEDLAGRGGN